MNEKQEISTFRRVLPQILASSAKNLLLLDLGMSVAFPTILIPSLKGLKAHDNNDILSITNAQASWFASIAFIFQPIGSILSGIVLEPLGRKKSMILVNIPHIIGWLLLYSASSITQLFIAGILLGLGVGFMEAPIVTYVGEICQPSIRGILTSCAGVAVMIGFSTVFFLGGITTWRITALICCSIPVITAIAICFVPETPYWLMSKNRKEEAKRSLMWLRGWVSDPKVIESEFKEIERYSEDSNRCIKCQKSDIKCTHKGNSTKDIVRELLRKRTLKPFFLVMVMFFFQQFSGLTAMRAYLVQIFQTFSVPIDANWATFVIGTLSLTANISCTALVKAIGKRKIAMISMVGTCVSMLSLTIYSFKQLTPGTTSFDKHDIKVHDDNLLGYIPLSLIFFLAFFTSFGLMPVPWILLSEVFPFKTRSMTGGIAAALNYIMGFITTKTYYNLETSLTLPGILLMYSIFDVIGMLFMYFFLPETEGRTLEEIELHFSDNNKKFHDIKIRKNVDMEKEKNKKNSGVDNRGFET